MGETILALLLLIAAGVIGYFVRDRSRMRRVVRGLEREVEARRGGGRVKMLTSEGPEVLRGLGTQLEQLLDEHEALAGKASGGETFRSVMMEMGHGFLMTDAGFQIVFANDALRRLFDLSGSPVGRPLIEVCRDHRFIEVMREASAKQRRVTADINVQGMHGGKEELPERLYEVEAATLPAGPSEGCWAMIRDVTEEALTEQVRKDFVANASHELRTPLTLINGYIETLEDGLIEDEEASKRSLAVMRKHSERLVRIIEDMLTISKLERAASRLRLEPFDVSECASDVIDHLAPLIEEKKAKVVLDIPDTDLSMHGDRFYWDQVFMNLIENALKENQRPGLGVTVSFKREGGQNVIKIRDDGVGIPRADLPFVFKRFFRGARHHSQEIKGTGLGLSIVKRAVEAHGGSISVESTPGIKTVFTITVPVEGMAVLEE